MQSVALQIKPLAHHISPAYGCRSVPAPACHGLHVLSTGKRDYVWYVQYTWSRSMIAQMIIRAAILHDIAPDYAAHKVRTARRIVVQSHAPPSSIHLYQPSLSAPVSVSTGVSTASFSRSN